VPLSLAWWNQIERCGVTVNGLSTKRGTVMPRSQLDNDTLVPAVIPGHRYLVVRHRDEWFIKFHGQVYGPYKTQREAMRFAIDAAYKLGEHGEESQVLSIDESGKTHATWTHGQHPFPPWQ
jgi:hypothetical protein